MVSVARMQYKQTALWAFTAALAVCAPISVSQSGIRGGTRGTKKQTGEKKTNTTFHSTQVKMLQSSRVGIESGRSAQLECSKRVTFFQFRKVYLQLKHLPNRLKFLYRIHHFLHVWLQKYMMLDSCYWQDFKTGSAEKKKKRLCFSYDPASNRSYCKTERRTLWSCC